MGVSYSILTIIFMVSINWASGNVEFQVWQKSFIDRYLQKGVPKSFLSKRVKSIKLIPEVIKKDRNQITLNTSVDYEKWIAKWLSRSEDGTRIELARNHLKENYDLLLKIEKKYLVEKEIIISLWAVETLFGKITGSYDIINALGTLAFDKRRRAFFEKELFSAIQILYQGHLKRGEFKGSWAGATGQCQFMPSSFILHAEDFDGDGKKDIWSNKADIFASIANYLKKSGWKYGKTLGDFAKRTRNEVLNKELLRTPKFYNKKGFRTLTGDKLTGVWKRRFAEIPFKGSPVILRGSNYLPLIRWNNSSLFVALNLIIFNGLRS